MRAPWCGRHLIPWRVSLSCSVTPQRNRFSSAVCWIRAAMFISGSSFGSRTLITLKRIFRLIRKLSPIMPLMSVGKGAPLSSHGRIDPAKSRSAQKLFILCRSISTSPSQEQSIQKIRVHQNRGSFVWTMLFWKAMPFRATALRLCVIFTFVTRPSPSFCR